MEEKKTELKEDEFKNSISITDSPLRTIPLGNSPLSNSSLRRVKIERAQIQNEHLRNDWVLCCSRTSPELIKYIVTVSVSMIVLIFSIVMIALETDDSNIYFNLLTFILGVYVKSPTLENKNSNQNREEDL